MFFTNVGRLVAWLLLILGSVRLWLAGYLAYVGSVEEPMPAFTKYLYFQKPEEAVIVSVAAITVALLLGVLSEISLYSVKR